MTTKECKSRDVMVPIEEFVFVPKSPSFQPHCRPVEDSKFSCEMETCLLRAHDKTECTMPVVPAFTLVTCVSEPRALATAVGKSA